MTLKWTGTSIQICKETEQEIKKAIADLVSRGFELIYGPECNLRQAKTFTQDEYGRHVFRENIQSQLWRARLRKEKVRNHGTTSIN